MNKSLAKAIRIDSRRNLVSPRSGGGIVYEDSGIRRQMVLAIVVSRGSESMRLEISESPVNRTAESTTLPRTFRSIKIVGEPYALAECWQSRYISKVDLRSVARSMRSFVRV
jgi:hypothetical protein